MIAPFALLLGALPTGYVRSHTCLLVGFMNGQIVLAADSLSTDPRPGRTAEVVCKLIRTDSFVFGNSGLSYVADVKFDVVANALEASRQSAELEAQVETFERSTQEDLRRAVEHLRSREPVAYGFLEKEDTVSSVVIAGRSAGRPALFNLEFRWREGRIITSRADSPEGTFLGLGRSAAAFAFLRLNPKFLVGRDVGEAFTKLVEIQESDTPGEVGGPVDVIVVDSSGSHWVRKKSACPETTK
jgi:hypothetical protein